MRYNYEIVFVPDKQLILTDGSSRYSVSVSESNSKVGSRDELLQEIDSYVNFIISSFPASKNMLDRIKNKQKKRLHFRD